MTVVDARQPVPELTADRKQALVELLAAEPTLVLAYLHGSRVRGGGPLSDIDLAVLLDRSLSSSRRDVVLRSLFAGMAKTIGTYEIDLVDLASAPPLLRHRVVRDGELLVEQNSRARVEFVRDTILVYLDTEHLRREMSKGLRHILEEDRFGRPNTR